MDHELSQAKREISDLRVQLNDLTRDFVSAEFPDFGMCACADVWAHINLSGSRQLRAPDLRVDRSCGLTADGHAWCWGAGWGGGLGNGQTGPRRVPVLVSGSVTFRAITVGALATCGIAADGAALCWGDNSTGALGVPLVPHD